MGVPRIASRPGEVPRITIRRGFRVVNEYLTERHITFDKGSATRWSRGTAGLWIPLSGSHFTSGAVYVTDPTDDDSST